MLLAKPTHVLCTALTSTRSAAPQEQLCAVPVDAAPLHLPHRLDRLLLVSLALAGLRASCASDGGSLVGCAHSSMLACMQPRLQLQMRSLPWPLPGDTMSDTSRCPGTSRPAASSRRAPSWPTRLTTQPTPGSPPASVSPSPSCCMCFMAAAAKGPMLGAHACWLPVRPSSERCPAGPPTEIWPPSLLLACSRGRRSGRRSGGRAPHPAAGAAGCI